MLLGHRFWKILCHREKVVALLPPTHCRHQSDGGRHLRRQRTLQNHHCTIMTTSFMTTNTSTISSPNNSTSMLSGESNHLSPQGGGTVAKHLAAVQRVQQFTGCHNTYKGSNSFGIQKGPLNLSFGMPRNQNEHHNQQVLGASSSSRIAPFGCGFYNQQPAQQQEQQWHQQQQQQEQEMYTKQANKMQSGNLDDFAIDDVSDLQELMDESSSFSGSRKDGYYF